MKKFKIVFMGTPDFAVPALRALHESGHVIAAVYCQPPKPAGRGQSIQKTPVHLFAESLGLVVRTPRTLREEATQRELASLAPDVIVVAAYGLILPQVVLDIPPLGCLNIHGSLLPRWRGAAPIQRALLAGDSETGITIMKMEAGLDTGPMILSGKISIMPSSTAQTLHDAMADLGASLIVTTLDRLAQGPVSEEPQPVSGVTYAAKLTREEGLIDWNRPAQDIERQVRAFYPWPSTFFMVGDEKIKLLHSECVAGQSGLAGTLLDDELTIACAQGALRLLSVQRAGKKPTDGASFLRGMRLERGHRFS